MIIEYAEKLEILSNEKEQIISFHKFLVKDFFN